jgi:hypothetical protein
MSQFILIDEVIYPIDTFEQIYKAQDAMEEAEVVSTMIFNGDPTCPDSYAADRLLWLPSSRITWDGEARDDLEAAEDQEWDHLDDRTCDEDDDVEFTFADPSGRSALRAAGPGNLRDLPCPSCRQPNRLTPADRDRGYQCDTCADAAERGFDREDY